MPEPDRGEDDAPPLIVAALPFRPMTSESMAQSTIDLGGGSRAVNVDGGTVETELYTVTQGNVSSSVFTGSYIKGLVRIVERDAGWIFDSWGKIALDGFTGEAAHPIVIDFAPLVAALGIGNEFRGAAGMAVGHAGGVLGGAPAEYLHLVYTPGDGGCCCRLVDLAGAEITTQITDHPDLLHWQMSVTTWDD